MDMDDGIYERDGKLYSIITSGCYVAIMWTNIIKVLATVEMNWSV